MEYQYRHENQSMTELWNRNSVYGHSLQNHYHNISNLSTATGDVLRYIDRMLMDEDMDDNEALQDSSNLQAKERSFYEALGQAETTDVVSRNFWLGVNEARKFLPSTTSAPVKESRENEDPVNNNSRGCLDDEFDTWTYVDDGCEKLASYVTDLRTASTTRRKTNKRKSSNSVDLTSVLISCAQAVALNDKNGANESLRRIKLHSSQFGDASQRVAHYMVRGLEARLDGRTGSWMHENFSYENLSASDYFAAYCTSLISSSFRRISIFASNKTIACRSKKFAKIHIIDFGILYGLQWPALIKRLSEREGGPPKKVRITGIDAPQPGCDPAERIGETGNRLIHYAEMFGVPFEYNAIVKSWESVRVEDLNIEEGEYVAVNCLFRAENLEPEDEELVLGPRSKFLELVRKMNPDVFVNGVVNGGYGVPYFVTRFREALFHFSSLFDMTEALVPEERRERMLLEGMLGNIAINVVACEGAERVHRPETSNQWRLRCVRAGLKQARFERKLLGEVVKKVKSCYHREFVVVEDDNKWLMMSWKGRTICALSCWEPDHDHAGASLQMQ